MVIKYRLPFVTLGCLFVLGSAGCIERYRIAGDHVTDQSSVTDSGDGQGQLDVPDISDNDIEADAGLPQWTVTGGPAPFVGESTDGVWSLRSIGPVGAPSTTPITDGTWTLYGSSLAPEIDK